MNFRSDHILNSQTSRRLVNFTLYPHISKLFSFAFSKYLVDFLHIGPDFVLASTYMVTLGHDLGLMDKATLHVLMCVFILMNSRLLMYGPFEI